MLAVEGDVSVLPSDFPRGVVGLVDDTGFLPGSFGDGGCWVKNFPLLGAFEAMRFCPKIMAGSGAENFS